MWWFIKKMRQVWALLTMWIREMLARIITASHFSGKISHKGRHFLLPNKGGWANSWWQWIWWCKWVITGEGRDFRIGGRDGSDGVHRRPRHLVKHTHVRTLFPRDPPVGRSILRTYTLRIPLDGFFVVPVLQLLSISQEKYLLLLTVWSLKKKKKRQILWKRKKLILNMSLTTET